MSDFLHRAIRATLDIIQLLQEDSYTLYDIHHIGAGGDRSIGADLMSERVYMEYLLPLASIDSEESGFIQSDSKDTNGRYIILDPLDGSDNFLSKIPYYGSSLALCDSNGMVIEAIIFNFCTQSAIARSKDRIFTFSLNAYLQKDTQAFKDIENLPLGKCGIFEKAYCHPDIAMALYEKGLKFRSLGASALSMGKAYEANFMLFVGNIRDFDSKAGLFICDSLYHTRTDNFTLISKDKHIFDMISRILPVAKG